MLPHFLSIHSPITVAVASDSFHPVFRFELGQMVFDGILTLPQQLRHLATSKVRIFAEDIENLVLRCGFLGGFEKGYPKPILDLLKRRIL